MDLKRFDEIGGREAFERLSNGMNIFNKHGVQFKVDFEQSDYLWQTPDGMIYLGSEDTKPLDLKELLSNTWYVKKPFDVRAEMLARPNEWVGAYKMNNGFWKKVGFSTGTLSPRQAGIWQEVEVNQTDTMLSIPIEFERCIPIEDVPQEELK